VQRLERRRFLSATAMTLAAVPLGIVGLAAQDAKSAAVRLSNEGAMPSLGGATEWLNSPPLTTAGLRGKVVLVDFCTYTCINWLRSLPYVRAWAGRYADRGLVTIGVHSPEFSVERNIANVRRAVKELRVAYPVAVDNDLAIWRAFQNQYWPAVYLVDVKGQIRFHHFGEGEYERCERVIQQLLVAAGSDRAGHELVSVEASGAEAAADWGSLKSQENYVGHQRTENFASPGGAARDKGSVYTLPARLKLNQWALSGNWTMEREAIALNTSGGRIVYQFHARDLHLVMGARTEGAQVRFQVRIDGQPPGAAHGVDADGQGSGTVREPRLYQLIRQSGSIADRRFEIEFLDSGAEAFAFTFG
jgi:hypothetical protein